MLDATSLLRVTESFYSAALGLTGWSGALDRLGDTLKAGHLFLFSPSRSPLVASSRIDEREFNRALSIWDLYQADAPRTEGVRDGSIALSSMLMPDDVYMRSRHYNELVRPLGGRYSIFGKATPSLRDRVFTFAGSGPTSNARKRTRRQRCCRISALHWRFARACPTRPRAPARRCSRRSTVRP